MSAFAIGCAGHGSSDVSPGVGACQDGDPLRERWGTDCLCCHATEFGVAGSLEPDAGISMISVSDREGRSDEMSPDLFDNFFRHQKLTPPLNAVVTFANGEQRRMRSAAPHGSCNACHGNSEPRLGSR
jgi:hypothetical protein